MRTALAFGVLVLFSGGRPGWAQPHAPLVYQGGPVLGTFTIYPLYYGNWNSTEMKAQQAYLVSLAAYISGAGAPPGEEPVIPGSVWKCSPRSHCWRRRPPALPLPKSSTTPPDEPGPLRRRS